MKKNLKINYKKQFNELRDLINEWDPYALIEGGAPKDEFDLEVAKILAGLSKCESAEETAELFSKIFGEYFSPKEFPLEVCKDIGKRVYVWYIKNEKVRGRVT